MIKNKTFLVTGASRGIGKSLSLFLAKEGAKVILLSSNERALEKTFDDISALNKVTPLICTFNLESAVAKDYQVLNDTLKEQDIILDGLIHCAGQLKSLTPIAQTPLSQWHRIMQINVNARFALTQTCLPFLQQSSCPQIIFLFSEKAFESGRAYWGTYQVTEKASLCLFEILSDEHEHSKLKINAIKLPNINTSLRKQAYPFEENDLLINPESLNSIWLDCFNEKIKHGDIIDACAENKHAISSSS